jgi:hypothetical protein
MTHSIIDEAKRTIKRVDKKLSQSRPDPHVETHAERWRREAEENDAARAAEKERMGLVGRTHDAVVTLQSDVSRIESEMRRDLVDALKGLNTFAEATYSRVEELTADVNNLRTALAASEKKVDELKQMLDKSQPGNRVIDLPAKRVGA